MPVIQLGLVRLNVPSRPVRCVSSRNVTQTCSSGRPSGPTTVPRTVVFFAHLPISGEPISMLSAPATTRTARSLREVSPLVPW